MEKVESHKMWCFACQKEFSIQSSWQEASCILCESPIVEKIENDPHFTEIKTQEIITRTNGNLKYFLNSLRFRNE